jgi:hypothetical protein
MAAHVDDHSSRSRADADAPRVPFTAAIPIRRQEVRAARTDLQRLATALRAEPAPHVRAVAAASLLLTDGDSPLFNRYCPPGTLREEAFRAAYHAEAG